MEKVYVLESGSIYGYEEYSDAPRVYRNRKDAIDDLGRIKEQFREEYVKEDGWLEEDSENSYSCWEDGCYSENRAWGLVTEVELQ